MGPVSTDDPLFWQTIGEWLREASDLLVDLYYPRSAGGGTSFLLRSLQDFEKLVAEARPKAVITVYREQQYPLRGVVDEAFIVKVQAEIGLQMPLAVMNANFFPVELEFLGESGSADLAEFLESLRSCLGQSVFVGKEPVIPAGYTEPNLDPSLLIARKWN